MSNWNDTYYEAKQCFENAKQYDDMKAKKMKLNEAYKIAYYCEGRHPDAKALMREIERYARDYGIDIEI